MIYYDILSSPIGDLTVATDGQSITALHIEGDRYFTAVPAGWIRSPDQPLITQLQAELEEYFAGTRTNFDVPIDFQGTPFQRLVWKALQEVPSGKTTSYGAVAEKIGKPKAVRAVGTAVGKNPVCIVVPCHRVLASNGSLGGYVAGLERKRHLLALENTLFGVV